MASMAKVMPLLSFGTLITVAVVPLAAGLYMVTTTAWTACERALLHRDRGSEDRDAATAAASATGKAVCGRRQGDGGCGPRQGEAGPRQEDGGGGCGADGVARGAGARTC